MAENKEIKILREYFLKREDVEMAFIFGSRAASDYQEFVDDYYHIYETAQSLSKE